MKKLISLAVLLICSIISFAQTQVFTVDHNGTTSVYSKLDTAIVHASSGDIIYLPGGAINFSGTLTKSLTLIGAGTFLDSTLATGQTYFTSLVTVNNVSNLYIIGCTFTNSLTIQNTSNIILDRCRIQSSSSALTLNASTAIQFNGCVINNDIKCTNASPLFHNCILYGGITASGAEFNNCILFKVVTAGCPCASCNMFRYVIGGTCYDLINSTFNNNILHCNVVNTSGLTLATNNNQFYNNIFTDTCIVGTTAQANNQFNKPLSSVLSGITNTVSYSPTDNFHLAPGSPAIGAGIGGTDIGIYGGASPFKEGMVPFNPHIQSANIPQITDQNGNLNINIKVSAQDN